MSSLFESALGPDSVSADFSELLPRLVLIEDALAGRRVLEVGTLDVRSLLRLSESGASRVAGTTDSPGRFSAASFRGHRIELITMEPGRLDFEDASFDAIIVHDLDRALASNPAFLEDVRRVLSSQGMCLMAFHARGRGLSALTRDDESQAAMTEPGRIGQMIRRVFSGARMYRQMPFVGVTILDEHADPDGASVSLDGSVAGPQPEASHLIALSGRVEPAPEERTLVELPYGEIEHAAEAARSRSLDDADRLRTAVATLRAELSEKDESLHAISQRLKPLRNAIETRLEELEAEKVKLREARESVAPTMIAPASSSPALEAELAQLRSELQGKDETIEALETRLETLARHDTRIEPSPAALEHELRENLERSQQEHDIAVAALAQSQAERERLEQQVRVLRTQLDLVRAEEDDLAEGAERAILTLESAAGAQEYRILELERELQTQLLRQQSLGNDHREAEVRAQNLQDRLERQALLHVEEVAELTVRLAAITQGLSESESERDALRGRVENLSAELEQAEHRAHSTENALERASQHFEGERQTAQQLEQQFSGARGEAEHLAHENAALERALQDRDLALEELRAQNAALQAQKTMLELAAGQATNDADGLRKRVQELRNERDTLAATSEMLLSERDEAREVARRTLGSEEEALSLAAQLERVQAELERAHEASESNGTKTETLEGQLAAKLDEHRQFEARVAEAESRATSAEEERDLAVDRLRSIDQSMAELQIRAHAHESRSDESDARARELEELVHETSREAQSAIRDLASWRERNEVLEAAAKEAEQRIGDALSAKARAEAELAELALVHVESEAERVKAHAHATLLQGRIQDLEKAQRKADKDSEQSRLGLGETLKQAAELTTKIAELEDELQTARTRAEEAELRGAEGSEADVAARQALFAQQTQVLAACEEIRRSVGTLKAFSRDSVRAVGSTSKDIARFQGWADLAMRHIASLERSLERNRRRYRKLEARVRDRAPALPVRADDEAVDVLRARLSSAESALDNARVSSFTLREENEQLSLGLFLANERLREMESDTLDLTSRLQASSEDRGDLQERLRLSQLRSVLDEEELEAARTIITGLRRRQVELHDHADALTLEVADRTHEIGLARSTLDALRGELSESHVELEQLRVSYASAVEALRVADRLQSDVQHSLTEQVAALQSQLDARERLLEEQSEKHAEAAARWVEARDDVERLRRQLEQKEAAFAEMESAVEQSEGQIRRELVVAQETVRQLQDELGRAQRDGEAQVAHIEAERARAAGRAAELDSALHDHKAQLAAARAELDGTRRELEARANELTRQVESLEARHAKAETREAELQAEKREMQAQLAELEARTPEGDVALAEGLRAQAEDRADKAESERKKADARAVAAEDRARHLEAQAQRAEDTRERAQKSLAAAEARKGELEEAATRAKADAHRAESELSPLTARVRQLETRAETAEQRALDAEHRVKSLEQELNQLNKKSKTGDLIETDLARFEARVRAANERADQANAALAEAGQRIAQLQQQVASSSHVQADSDASQVQLTAAREEIAMLRRQLQAAQANGPSADVAALQNALAERQTDVERLRRLQVRSAQELDESRAEIGRRLEELHASAEQLEQKQREVAALNEHLEVLKAKLARQGEAETLTATVRERESQLERMGAQRSAQESEIQRLRAILQSAEQAQVQQELRVAELETAVAESNRKLEMLQRDLAEKTDRIRRMNEFPD